MAGAGLLMTQPPSTSYKPPSLYQARIWRACLFLARATPARIFNGLCLAAAVACERLNTRRRQVIAENLLPVVGGNRETASRMTRALFRNFALKMADLWRFESGLPVPAWHIVPSDWEAFMAAKARGKGVLILSPHLGNWELGGPLLSGRGVKLHIITQPEPEDRLTELRKVSRARWGIETLVAGHDTFAFVEIIKRLQGGAVVAVLIDRPPPGSGVRIEFFGRPFTASVAAAELARATGCALLGVYIVPEANGYLARFLPEFHYDRQELGSREKRCEYTGHIMRAFEPVIRQHASQWYHFIPMWSDSSKPI